MSKVSPSGTNLYQALQAENFPLPDDCANVTLTLPVNDVVQLHYVINVSGENLAKLGRALARLGLDYNDSAVLVERGE